MCCSSALPTYEWEKWHADRLPHNLNGRSLEALFQRFWVRCPYCIFFTLLISTRYQEINHVLNIFIFYIFYIIFQEKFWSIWCKWQCFGKFVVVADCQLNLIFYGNKPYQGLRMRHYKLWGFFSSIIKIWINF